jgi:hypothetical protein
MMARTAQIDALNRCRELLSVLSTPVTLSLKTEANVPALPE